MLTERCSAEHKDARSKWFPKILRLALATFTLSSSSSVDLISLKPFLRCRQEREQVFELEARTLLICVVFTKYVSSRVSPCCYQNYVLGFGLTFRSTRSTGSFSHQQQDGMRPLYREVRTLASCMRADADLVVVS